MKKEKRKKHQCERNRVQRKKEQNKVTKMAMSSAISYALSGSSYLD